MMHLRLPWRCGRNSRAGLVVAALTAASCTADAASSPTYFLSVQDGRAGLVNGEPLVRQAADTIAVIELDDARMRVIHEVAMPTSLVGPPTSIAVAPNGRLALVTAATRRDPADPGKVVPYDRVTVVALDPTNKAPPRVLAGLTVGLGTSGVSINPSGTLALVANRIEGSISILKITGEEVSVIGKVALPDKSGPAHVAFFADGRRAIVTRDDNRVSLLTVTDTDVTLDRREIAAGLRPYGLDVSPDGRWAAITNLGMGQGDADTISLIDLGATPPRVIDTVTAGQTPEGIFFTADGRGLGVTVMDGSNKPEVSPFHGTARYRRYTLDAGRLRPLDEVVGGAWLQGHASSADGRAVLVQDAAIRQVRLYRAEAGGTLKDTGTRLQFEGAPCAVVGLR